MMAAGIYCDYLSRGAYREILRLRSSIPEVAFDTVRILDGQSDSSQEAKFRRLLDRAGFKVEEVDFFTGYLLTPEGESVYLAARRQASELALREARNLIEEIPFFKSLNRRWKNDTVLLHIAKNLHLPMARTIMRMMAVHALATKDGYRVAHLILHQPAGLKLESVEEEIPGIRILFCQRLTSRTWVEGIRTLARKLATQLRNRKASRPRTDPSAPIDLKSPIAGERSSTLLVAQEDDVSMDRSLRTQPHWIFPDNTKPNFSTLILQSASIRRLPPDHRELVRYGISVIHRDDLNAFRYPNIFVRPERDLFRDFLSCICRFAFQRSAYLRDLYIQTGLLIYRAWTLAGLCRKKSVRAFVSCENYMIEPVSMQLIAPHLRIKTFSYQYSNMSCRMVGQIPAAATMLTFSPHYQKCFDRPGLEGSRFVNIGYAFDSSFAAVRSRADEHRRQLEKRGARFIICYFDENVLYGKYGLIGPDDSRKDLLHLIGYLLEDELTGLIIKGQFQSNAVGNQKQLAEVIERAEGTGRFLEFSYGQHRNIILPSEAALAADITIGHAVGATASLEAALAGVRSILVNPYGARGNNDVLYAKAKIVFPSLSAALDAVRKFKAGDADYFDLGDWSPIVSFFDPFRDGRSAARMRDILEEAMKDRIG